MDVKDDKNFKDIDALARKLLKKVEASSDFALQLHISQRIDEDTLNAYSITCGDPSQIVDSIYVDLLEQIQGGNLDLYNELHDMIISLSETVANAEVQSTTSQVTFH